MHFNINIWRAIVLDYMLAVRIESMVEYALVSPAIDMKVHVAIVIIIYFLHSVKPQNHRRSGVHGGCDRIRT